MTQHLMHTALGHLQGKATRVLGGSCLTFHVCGLDGRLAMQAACSISEMSQTDSGGKGESTVVSGVKLEAVEVYAAP